MKKAVLLPNARSAKNSSFTQSPNTIKPTLLRLYTCPCLRTEACQAPRRVNKVAPSNSVNCIYSAPHGAPFSIPRRCGGVCLSRGGGEIGPAGVARPGENKSDWIMPALILMGYPPEDDAFILRRERVIF